MDCISESASNALYIETTHEEDLVMLCSICNSDRVETVIELGSLATIADIIRIATEHGRSHNL